MASASRGPVLHGALVGAIAGALAALVDGVQAWARFAQFAPPVATRVRTIAYLVTTYGLVGALAGAALAAGLLLVGWSLVAAGRRDRWMGLALAGTIAPSCGLAAWIARRGLVRALAQRKHHGLMIAGTQTVTVLAMAGAVAAGIVIAGVGLGVVRRARSDTGTSTGTGTGTGTAWSMATTFAVLLVPLVAAALLVSHALVLHAFTPRQPPRHIVPLDVTGRRLVSAAMTHTLVALAIAVALAAGLARLLARPLRRLAAPPAAPAVAAWLLAVASAAAFLDDAHDTLSLVRARPLYLALLGLALVLPAWPLARRLAALRPLARATTTPRRRALVTAGLPLALLVTAAAAGNRASVVKAAVAYSGLGDPITRALTGVFDLDRDGHSALFGGDDCNDLDASIHPGALDLPDDGIDQNCVAGDAHAGRTTDDVGMIPLPAGVPADANIILLTIDTLRADHLGAYGYARPTSPNLDALAAAGARFAHGWAHAPSTRYSMPAILTGRLPLDVYYDYSIPGWPGLLPRATTIAELLAPRGFTTAAITSYSYFDPSHRMNQGFAFYDNEDARLHEGSDPAHTRGSSSRQQTDKALAFLAAHGQERFFLWIHYYDPHHDYEVHPEVPSFGTDDMARYDGEIRFTDLHIGRLLDDLKARGLWDKTIIVVTGDHGEGFGEHDIYFHGYDLYGAQTRVPLIIRVPGLAPRVVETPAGHVDIMPTLANLAGVPANPEMMGSSLLGWIAGSRADDPDRAVFQQVQYEGNHDKRGAATAHCHVLYDITPHTSWQIYDLDRDPGETRDISGSPGRCLSARRTFERWFDSAQIPAGAAEALLSGPPDLAHPLDIDLGPDVRLLAVDLPAQVKAGDVFDITWTFAARGRLADGWKVFVHFEAPTGGRFTADHAPARPFAWWKAGQYIRYTITASVPATAPPGDYALWTGLWRKQARQPVLAPPAFEVKENRVHVATLKVVR
ncbi:MAG TPA: sulfatase-like hydrolase/transferase [Kofleriaceae bacterium]|nr:sulfatase-like hydrolase/transferase [Kofleriaceae bacterium]